MNQQEEAVRLAEETIQASAADYEHIFFLRLNEFESSVLIDALDSYVSDTAQNLKNIVEDQLPEEWR